MSKIQCQKKFKKRNIRKALIRAGVPVNINANLDDDDLDYNEDDGNDDIFTQYISNITSCDARCREENRRNEILRMTYENAKQNVVTAPSKRNVAEKNYYTSVYGQGEYNELLEERYKNEIKQTTNNERNNFNLKKERLLLILENYDKNIALNSKLNELVEITLMDNNQLIEKIEKITSTINTNERKTYYNDQQLINMKKWKVYTMRALFLLYAILFISIIVSKKNNLNYKIFVKFILLLLIPLLLIPILTRIILTFYNFITNDASNMGPLQLISKILLESSGEFKLFFETFYAPIEILAL